MCNEHSVTCDECDQAYDGDPPCDECECEPLYRINALPWRIWTTCHRYGRDGMSGSIKLDTILSLCRAYGASEVDLELVLTVEQEVWPMIKPGDS